MKNENKFEFFVLVFFSIIVFGDSDFGGKYVC